MKKFLRWILNAKLSVKVIVYYLTVFILFASLCFLTFERLNANMTEQKIKQLSSDSVNTISSNLDLIIDTVNNQSKMLISSSAIQSVLRSNGLKDYTQKQIDNYLTEFTNFYEAISSIYIFDNNGHEYYVENDDMKNLSLKKLKSTDWYKELDEKFGGYILKVNAGGAFDNTSRNYISLMRRINDINTQKPIGYMVVNISTDYIYSSFGKQVNDTKIIVCDENRKPVISSGNIDGNELKLITESIKDGNVSQYKKIKGKQHIIASVKNDYGWTIATITPINELAAQEQTFKIFVAVLMLITLVMFAVSIMFISLSITRPINRLAKAMSSVKDGNFTEVHIRKTSDEIGMLQNVYNIMVREIQTLFKDMVNEQKAKRKAELEALQLQIKPHFLYNSFDAISSLALSGQNKEVYKIVVALGKFYKSFLNSGSETVTINEELEMIKQYLTIQLIRFKDKFTVDWQIDDNVRPLMIPRLTLQPLVENAIKHGIKDNPQAGILLISAALKDGMVVIKIKDNGQGMDEIELEKLLNGEKSGAGLKITRERLKLYFDSPVFEVKSEKGKGCEATIIFPAIKEKDNNE
ncbi:integral membrane sensor signal transduction histidine kinase [[Clostridium] cellulosi]|uniref:histidine kinase n=1 Tax=[Clostridium] cellulosi TaxID=29343 RepID=A0A078KQ33_9FIRM|nr:integral membrane sensor signal transduction histidine kinase [[Clostridium] cellulosi]